MTDDTVKPELIFEGSSSWWGIAVLALVVAFAALACGTDDVGSEEGSTSCQSDIDCDLGMVCNNSNQCVEAACDFCVGDQICYITQENPEGTCSAPECFNDSDCDGDIECHQNICGGPYNASQGSSGCSSSDDCDDGQVCTPGGSCVDDDTPVDPDPNGNDDEDECSTADDCDGDQLCESGECIDDDSGNNMTCELQEEDCTGGTPLFDADTCECVECMGPNDCIGDNVCTDGTCVEDDSGGNGPDPDHCEPCDPGQAGTCGGDTPYCVQSCCVQCIGSGDCTGNEACIDGFCSEPGGCSTDAECPAGYSCDGGQCQAPETGGDCDPQDPGSCPDGQFCSEDGQCEALGGDFGCGFCLDDCTCGGDLVCDGDFICTGCEPTLDDPLSGGCPDGGFCFDGLCFPFSF